ncbi:GspH/FimT family pseudopilin [Motiliproteus sp. SC1-56]|uniref:GspH/FimT family pseudopilin n=1 Tax=Motiliproteus sp. SC1-56 TaxID=2799565 RepID=UPI001A8EC322|nr:GspH/FimT family pseudopilin [Motiliproteus sp. SC1-56]
MRKDRAAPLRAQLFPPRRNQGFTLNELLLTLGVITLVSTLGMGSFQRYIGDVRADTVILNLRTALMLARSEAIKGTGSVVLCRRKPGQDQCAGSSAKNKLFWDSGWLVFADADENKLFDGDDRLIRQFPPLDESFALKWNRGDYIAYEGDGSLDSNNGTFCLGSRHLDGIERELAIPHTGRVRVTAGECSYTLLP